MSFKLFQSHLDLAHGYWTQLLQPSDSAIDATCGNGRDTLKLAQLIPEGILYAIDIQPIAIECTQKLLKEHISTEQLKSIRFEARSHATFPENIAAESIKLIAYNLGYLPGGNKQLTTMAPSTLLSVKNGLKLICPGGALSITLYPGHPEGAIEQNTLLTFISTLDPKTWNCCLHTAINREASPQLLLIQRTTYLGS